MPGSVWDLEDAATFQSPSQLQIPQQFYTANERSSNWDITASQESFSSTTPLQKDARPSDVYANLDQVPTMNSGKSLSFFQRFKTLIFIVLGLITAGCLAAAIAVPTVLATRNNESSSSTETTTITGSVTSGASTASTVSTASTSASTSVSTSPSTSVSTSSTTSGSISASTSASTSPSTSSSSSSTASTASTASTTVATTTAPLVNPCVSGIYWNVTRITAAGTGSSNVGLNQLSSPTGIYLDSNDNLYIADGGNYRLMRLRPNNTTGVIIAGVTNIFGANLSLFSTGMRYIYVDASENVYVADTYNNRVLYFVNGSTTGVIVAGNGTFGTSLNQVYYPYGIWVDSSSNVYVTEYQNNRVTKWVPGATSGIVIASNTTLAGNTANKLSSPAGLYYDEANDDLYIANSGSANTIMKWRVGATNGTVIAGVAGASGNSSTSLRSPMGITLDQWMNLYVADRSNNRIQLFCNGSSTGITIAGASTGGTSINAPYDVKFDSKMNLYVSENSGARVTKFAKL